MIAMKIKFKISHDSPVNNDSNTGSLNIYRNLRGDIKRGCNKIPCFAIKSFINHHGNKPKSCQNTLAPSFENYVLNYISQCYRRPDAILITTTSKGWRETNIFQAIKNIRISSKF